MKNLKTEKNSGNQKPEKFKNREKQWKSKTWNH